MPLGKRFVTVDYLAKEGRVEPNPFLLKEEAGRAYEVQNKQEQEAEAKKQEAERNAKIAQIKAEYQAAVARGEFSGTLIEYLNRK